MDPVQHRRTSSPGTPRDPDRRAFHLLAQGWDRGFCALLHDDERAARAVLRTGPVRRSAIRRALEVEQRRGTSASPDRVPLLADALEVDRLLVRLAQTVLTEHEHPLLPHEDRALVAGAHRRGVERLCLLADTVPRPLVDDLEARCSRALVDVAAGLGDDRSRTTGARTCRALVDRLVEVDRLLAAS
jgi:hypothetical protein